MIQRIQSIYLLGALVCSLLLYFTAIASVTTAVHTYNFSIWGLVDVTKPSTALLLNTQVLLVANTVLAILYVLCIFQFKNRNRQIGIARLSLLLLVAATAGIFFYFERGLKQLQEVEQIQVIHPNQIEYHLGAVLPIIALIFALMAIYSIKKDEKLVRAADRIR